MINCQISLKNAKTQKRSILIKKIILKIEPIIFKYKIYAGFLQNNTKFNLSTNIINV